LWVETKKIFLVSNAHTALLGLSLAKMYEWKICSLLIRPKCSQAIGPPIIQVQNRIHKTAAKSKNLSFNLEPH
jgi:hypothetical protein